MRRNQIIILVSGIVTVALLATAIYFISLSINQRGSDDLTTTQPVSTASQTETSPETTKPEPEKTYTLYKMEILNNSAAYELQMNYFFDEGRIYVETEYFLDGASREHLIIQNDFPGFTDLFSSKNDESTFNFTDAVLNTKHNKIYMIAGKDNLFGLYVYSLKDNTVKLLDKGKFQSLNNFKFSPDMDYVVYNYVHGEKDLSISIYGCVDDKVIVSMNKTAQGSLIGKIGEDPLNAGRVFSFTFNKWIGANEIELEEYSHIPGSGSETKYIVKYNFSEDKITYPPEKPIPVAVVEETEEPEEEPVVEEETTVPAEEEVEEEPVVEEETTQPEEEEIDEEPVEVPEETTEPPAEEEEIEEPAFDPDSATIGILKSFYDYAAGGEYEKAYELFDDSFTTQSRMFMGFRITKAEVPLDFFKQFAEGTGIFKGVKIQEIFKEEKVNSEVKIFYTQSLAIDPGKDPQIFPLIATLKEKDGVYKITRVDDAIF